MRRKLIDFLNFDPIRYDLMRFHTIDEESAICFLPIEIRAGHKSAGTENRGFQIRIQPIGFFDFVVIFFFDRDR